uniref:transcription factor AP-4 isoform X2 n=1 Tax=Myxine glutinosa TaxID=7769 RepID=UPI0035901E3C
MAYYVVSADKAGCALGEFRKAEKEVIGGLCSLGNLAVSPESQRDQERRIRREIANSNERRRMQSINAGFQSLKTLIPHTDGEKLSKAAILQQTAEYIFTLEQEKTRLLQQNSQLKRLVQGCDGASPKRRRAEDRDEGIGSPDILEEDKVEELRREMIELRTQLDKERRLRLVLEEQVRGMEAQLYPEKLKEIAQQAQVEVQDVEGEHSPCDPRIATHDADMQDASPLGELPLALSSLQHPTVIVPAPTPPHHVTVVTMAPPSVISSVSTSRQNLETIVQAIQHIEGTQDEEERREVIVRGTRRREDGTVEEEGGEMRRVVVELIEQAS